jgi:hypothetical protein
MVQRRERDNGWRPKLTLDHVLNEHRPVRYIAIDVEILIVRPVREGFACQSAGRRRGREAKEANGGRRDRSRRPTCTEQPWVEMTGCPKKR